MPWWDLLESICWMSQHHPNCHHCCVVPSLYWTWQHTVTDGTQSRGSVLLMQRPPFATSLAIPAKSWPSCLAGRESVLLSVIPSCSWQIDYFRLPSPPPHSCPQSYWLCVIAIDTFSDYSVAILVRSVDSSHTALALETNLYHVFGLWDHLVCQHYSFYCKSHSALVSDRLPRIPTIPKTSGIVELCKFALHLFCIFSGNPFPIRLRKAQLIVPKLVLNSAVFCPLSTT